VQYLFMFSFANLIRIFEIEKYFNDFLWKKCKIFQKYLLYHFKTNAMSGEQLRNLLSDMGFANVSELARLLGMKNAQNLHAAFSAQDIKTGLLEDIAKALNIPVADFYPANNAVAEHGIAVAGNGNSVSISEKVLDLMREKDKQIDRLLTIIEKQ